MRIIKEIKKEITHLFLIGEKYRADKNRQIFSGKSLIMWANYEELWANYVSKICEVTIGNYYTHWQPCQQSNACSHKPTHTLISVCMSFRTCIYIYIYICVCIRVRNPHIYMYIYICVCVCVSVHPRVCVCVRACVLISIKEVLMIADYVFKENDIYWNMPKIRKNTKKENGIWILSVSFTTKFRKVFLKAIHCNFFARISMNEHLMITNFSHHS